MTIHQMQNPLIDGQTFKRVKTGVGDVHTKIKLNSPVKQSIKSVKNKMYPNFTHTYTVPKGW